MDKELLIALRQEIIARSMARLEKAAQEEARLRNKVKVLTCIKYEPDWIYYREFKALNKN